jgi:hypothetical protein
LTRQYSLEERARSYGFSEVVVIDQDLGISASGALDRPGFRDLVGQVCEGVVGDISSPGLSIPNSLRRSDKRPSGMVFRPPIDC